MNKDKIIEYHNENVSVFAGSANGNRNAQLNKQAMASFQLSELHPSELSQSRVEADYTAKAKALGLSESEIKATLASALRGAKDKPRQDTGHTSTNHSNKAVDLTLAPVYSKLAEYAKAHGVTAQVFKDAGWKQATHDGRVCLQVPCEDDINRLRFLDGQQPKWKPERSGVKPVWYGFERAVDMAKSGDKTLVLCNGQPSVVVAQHFGIAAIAQTDGEGKYIEKVLLLRLKAAIVSNSLKVIIAMDGDDTGREWSAKRSKQLTANGIKHRIVNFGGDDHYDLADYCRDTQTDILKKLSRLASYSDKQVQPVVSRRELASVVLGTVLEPEKYVSAGELLVVPFKSFHQYGGFAYMLEPGKMTEILAPSGSGKTSFMETWNDAWNMKGIDTMFFSPEWKPISIQHRAIQRYSGISTIVIKQHIQWHTEAERGIPEAQRMGSPIVEGSDLYKRYLAENKKISRWPGIAYCFQGQKLTEGILTAMTNQLYLLRRRGRRVGVAFFDYAQLLHTVVEENGRNSYEIICGMIKRWCIEHDIHAIVGSQPTKAVGDNSKQTGKLLGKYDSMWIRPDEFNLIITLNIKHNKVGDEYKPTPYAIAHIAKNNEGQEGVSAKLTTNFRHLCWMDEQWNPRDVSLKGASDE
jgi:energy-coupling factor transporter ATP-binding protein EcfA2